MAKSYNCMHFTK